MSWWFRTLSMFIIVAAYYLVIFPNTSGWVRGVSCLMVGIGMLLFGIASIIRVMPVRERTE